MHLAGAPEIQTLEEENKELEEFMEDENIKMVKENVGFFLTL